MTNLEWKKWNERKVENKNYEPCENICNKSILLRLIPRFTEHEWKRKRVAKIAREEKNLTVKKQSSFADGWQFRHAENSRNSSQIKCSLKPEISPNMRRRNFPSNLTFLTNRVAVRFVTLLISDSVKIWLSFGFFAMFYFDYDVARNSAIALGSSGGA